MMATGHHGQTKGLAEFLRRAFVLETSSVSLAAFEDVLEVLNLFFTVVFILEAVSWKLSDESRQACDKQTLDVAQQSRQPICCELLGR